MRRASYESAAAPESHNAADPAELNVVCRTKPKLPNQTDSSAALLPYLRTILCNFQAKWEMKIFDPLHTLHASKSSWEMVKNAPCSGRHLMVTMVTTVVCSLPRTQF